MKPVQNPYSLLSSPVAFYAHFHVTFLRKIKSSSSDFLPNRNSSNFIDKGDDCIASSNVVVVHWQFELIEFSTPASQPVA